MSETAKKNAMRGAPVAAKAPPKEPEPQPESTEEVTDEEDEEPEDEELPAPVATQVYPRGVEVLEDQTWVYSLQFEPRQIPKVKDGKIVEEKDEVSLPFKVRIPAELWAKNIREASRDASNEGEVLFFLSCSMCHISPKVMDRFDARDYSVISNRCNDVLQGRVKSRPGNG